MTGTKNEAILFKPRTLSSLAGPFHPHEASAVFRSHLPGFIEGLHPSLHCFHRDRGSQQDAFSSLHCRPNVHLNFYSSGQCVCCILN